MNYCGNMPFAIRQLRRWTLLVVLVMSSCDFAYSQFPDSFSPAASSTVRAIVVQPDGKILAGGGFATIGGFGQQCIARLEASGVVDTEFSPSANATVVCTALQSDGKILLGGYFTSIAGQPRSRLARLNRDGSLDATFNPGVDGDVNCLAIQPDGNILVGGYFSIIGGAGHTNIARLTPSGLVDSTFNPDANYSSVDTIVVQSNGMILIGGSFTTLNGQPKNCLGRLHANGNLDESFDPQPDNSVFCMTVQPDGGVIFGGNFTTVAGQPRQRLARINSSGTLDLSFNPNANATVWSLSLQANGRLLVGGAFTNLAGLACNRIGRLEASGALDLSFNASANGTVFETAIQPDGKVLLGGDFTTLSGVSRSRMGRLTNNDAMNESLAFDGANITWLRTGSSPEVAWTRFEASTNGVQWIDLGFGERIPTGWQLTNVSVVAGSTIRARGFLLDGNAGGPNGFVENAVGAPVFTIQPLTRTNLASSTATFVCEAVGSSPLAYQWLRDGNALTNAGKFSGVQTQRLTITNVFGAEAGIYSVVVSNPVGVVTSAVAVLNVSDPWIANQPPARYVIPGQNAIFSASAIGTTPTYFQWRKDGTNLPNRTASLMTLTNAQSADAGYYSVVVSNQFGSVTSSVAALTVNLSTPDSFVPPSNPDLFGVALQTDGKVVIGGGNTSFIGSGPGKLARLKTDGTLDTTFSATVGDSVFSIAIQPDGKILPTGWLTSLSGQSRAYVGRLHANGSLETTFNPNATGGVLYPGVYAVLIQSDGKIIMGGDFRNLAGRACTNLGRLFPDGSFDTNFTASASSIVYSLALQPDGKVLVGGEFLTLSGQSAQRIGRLNSNGTRDTNFIATANDIPLAFAVQSDGKIIAVGPFTSLSGQAKNRIGRLNHDGSLDTNFTATADGNVRTVALQSDGRILVGGLFSTLGGLARTNLGRLWPDGSPDLNFNPGANGVVYAITLQPDGKILVAGAFTALSGLSRSKLCRLNNTAVATENLSFDGATILWLRGGTSPEIARASFDASTDGFTWDHLGDGERVIGGWQITGLNLPTNTAIRAQGYVTGGRYGCSSWFATKTLNVNTNGAPRLIVENSSSSFSLHGFGFDLTGLAVRNVVVEASTNLTTWSPLWTNLLGNAPLHYQDFGATNFLRRFYRAKLQ